MHELTHTRWLVFALACFGTNVATSAVAADYRAEAISATAPADEIGPDVMKTLSKTGTRVIRGTSRTVCDVWVCASWDVPQLEPKSGLSYPFRPGQLLGVVHFPRKSSDFRAQTIDPGTYTLRYGVQPTDGAHEGTSLTRDFLMLCKAAEDQSVEDLDYDSLAELSAAAMGTSHPGILSLKQVEGSNYPAMRHMDEDDWWLVRLQSEARAGGRSAKVLLDVVIVGEAAE